MAETLICPATGAKLEVREEDVERFIAAGYSKPEAKGKRTHKKKEAEVTEEVSEEAEVTE